MTKKNEKINLSYDKTNGKILSIEIHNYDSIIDLNNWFQQINNINSIVFIL